MKAEMFNFSGWVEETDPKTIFQQYYTMLQHAGFNILDTCEHHFEPFGYTALFLLSESHFAIHTFPEEGQTYIELSSCVKKQYDQFMHALQTNIKLLRQ